MSNIFETIFGTGFMTLFGDPNLAGIGVIAFFTGAVLLVPSHPAVKAMAFFGGCILALPFFGWSIMLLGWGLGIILFFAARRFWG